MKQGFVFVATQPEEAQARTDRRSGARGRNNPRLSRTGKAASCPQGLSRSPCRQRALLGGLETKQEGAGFELAGRASSTSFNLAAGPCVIWKRRGGKQSYVSFYVFVGILLSLLNSLSIALLYIVHSSTHSISTLLPSHPTPRATILALTVATPHYCLIISIPFVSFVLFLLS